MTITNPTREEIYALIDIGANRDFISTQLANRLGLEISIKWTKLFSVNSTTEGMSSRDRSYTSNVRDALVGDFTAAGGDIAPAKRDLSKCRHLDGIEFIDRGKSGGPYQFSTLRDMAGTEPDFQKRPEESSFSDGHGIWIHSIRFKRRGGIHLHHPSCSYLLQIKF